MVPRSRCDLLPFYARLVAALHPVMPDLSQELNEMLLDEFRWHVAKKDQVNLEMKLKTVRFIGKSVLTLSCNFHGDNRVCMIFNFV
ncbi:unnamed protein product [Dibothriocephalus latus]|uniref:MIF4G domain-containing protein n=1 Tax=Dibothriocephalus latus TaxID=60516 RepID=A0A3P7P4I2_DIBLA|nr:unnamed protein product [Dibothriocephalus latus]